MAKLPQFPAHVYIQMNFFIFGKFGKLNFAATVGPNYGEVGGTKAEGKKRRKNIANYKFNAPCIIIPDRMDPRN